MEIEAIEREKLPPMGERYLITFIGEDRAFQIIGSEFEAELALISAKVFPITVKIEGC